MDTTQAITHLSLCAGYGGIDLGLKRAIPGLRTIAFSEIEAFACANLVAKMEAGFLDPAPIWTDLKTFPWASFRGKVDILSGGYPCQPFSAAGKRLGKDDPRHLWPWIADGIVAMRPNVCFFENVEGHISLGLEDVLRDLQRIGYTGTFGIFSASEVGAPHQRKRLFLLAHRKGAGLEGYRRLVASGVWHDSAEGGAVLGDAGHGAEGGRSQPVGAAHAAVADASGDVADADDCGGGEDCKPTELRADRTQQPSSNSGRAEARSFEQIWPSRPGQPQHEWEPPRVVGNADCGGQSLGLNAGSSSETVGRRQSNIEPTDGRQTEPSLGGDADGPAGGMDYAELCVSGDNRTDELRLLGNGVVPATAAIAFTTLMQEMFP
ncbi:MAG: DNA cytosine methyltransferase [Proteobacteria bacterium]|uniref:DNA (cytosine-5-)-methyltransferase n=1 Tax=Candidatus Fonsibacter lacus TaxID=2576439 RepID=A0A964XRQ4_9PROT|nr:DNA cytosine methyltransferase [Candidatus Fonsibacter lacus]NCU72298.1 DNA cytosine methyltransferase [Candidatus Fonsibacter lacus]